MNGMEPLENIIDLLSMAEDTDLQDKGRKKEKKTIMC